MSDLPIRPLLAPWREYAIGTESVVLRHADGAVVFEGRASTVLLPELLRLLDGSRTVPDLVEELGRPVEPAVKQALQKLDEHGLLLEGDHTATDPTARTARSLAEMTTGALPLSDLADLVASASALVIGDGGVARELERLLAASGLTAVRRIDERDAHRALADETENPGRRRVVVAAPGSPFARVLHETDAWSRSTGIPWTQVLPYDGSRAIVGPTYVPGQTGCYDCFRVRRRSTVEWSQEAATVDSAADRGQVFRTATWNSTAQDAFLAGCAAQLLLWSLVPRDVTVHPLLGRAFALEWSMAGPTVRSHRLFRVPRCRTCSPVSSTGVPQPWFAPLPEEGDRVLETVG